MPTVDESMTTCWDLSSTTWMPLIVGYFSRPELWGSVRTTAPFDVTVKVWASVSTVLMWASPIVKFTERSTSPHTLLPASTLASLATTEICSPTGQYSRG